MIRKAYLFQLLGLLLPAVTLLAQPPGDELLDRIDANMSAKTRYVRSTMIIHGPRSSRTIELESWSKGKSAFTEYLAPAREKGSKMLKLENKLWIFNPSTDRTIQIAGHMLRQSLMGSDLSYEDMMDNPDFKKKYMAVVVGSERYRDIECWVVEMTARSDEVAYQLRKLWVDKNRYLPLKEELYARSGKLLKRMELTDIQLHGSRWYPGKITFKDMLKKGKGTEFIIDEILFNVNLPDHILTKASLR
ncbi:MAG: outer membrane lipoprotein-sorting protein [Bacteroidetes bacterium]|nr:MAG: outer membrane lipoprotein-sorting protein [Bacteroidota bacterium]